MMGMPRVRLLNSQAGIAGVEHQLGRGPWDEACWAGRGVLHPDAEGLKLPRQTPVERGMVACHAAIN